MGAANAIIIIEESRTREASLGNCLKSSKWTKNQTPYSTKSLKFSKNVNFLLLIKCILNMFSTLILRVRPLALVLRPSLLFLI